ncbi:WD40 repeat-like protein [Phialemonium atrogriseum]|uniref:WD40 repeat-like protein n=1 Tax=Phialemonium atrogriseum TaxID=1093897 RepID=A0AAJ0C959_9PEZI|nr:WD40 repeat-like protein [Phialemonium atrogriseum]KAK1772460.1 WD40 repeat-like protein [Phialemonium atrogriseum]
MSSRHQERRWDPHAYPNQRVIGTTCSSPTGFDTVQSSFAYVAGGAVVVVDVRGGHYSQRFYRARPTAVPIFSVSPVSHAPSTPNSTPKANDSRNRVAASPRDSLYGPLDWSDSPTSKTWTSRERIKAATCLALSCDGRYLAVGETGYAPRVLIYNLQDNSSDTPLVSISEHMFGVRAVAWSQDTRYLASLGAANDGFLYLWKIDPRTGAARLFQQNRCTSFIRGMIWMGNSLVTLGVRHVKVWRVEEGGPNTSPTKSKFSADGPLPQPQTQKALPGRNILLGSLLDSTFTCAAAIDENRAIICSESGDICLLDDTQKQMKLIKILEAGFVVNCTSIRQNNIYIGGKGGEIIALSVDMILEGHPDPILKSSRASNGLLAMGFLADNMVTINTKRSIDIWGADYLLMESNQDTAHIPIPGHGDPIVGIQQLHGMNKSDAPFFTWSACGRVNLWDLEGRVKSSFDIGLEQIENGTEPDRVNQLVIVRATRGAKQFIAGDKFGVIRVIDHAAGECCMEIKAHSSDCQDITVYEDDTRVLVASCGRDRTAQLFRKSGDGAFEHFQTLEFSARVVQVLIPSHERIVACSLDRTLQVHDLVLKEGEPDVMAAVPLKVISLKATPLSMAMPPDGKSIYVSLLDRSVCQYDTDSGRLSNSFKCIDEGGIESVVLDSLTYGKSMIQESTFLLGISNTDKSVRIYDSQTGAFLDREWGHTEAINGVLLLDDEEGGRKVVSVGSDGTIMIWGIDMQEPSTFPASREPSPEKSSFPTSNQPPLRRVLSRAELAEFQRPSSSPVSGRRSPPRTLQRRTSRYNLSSSAANRTPTTTLQTSPASTIAEHTPSRRPSSGGSRSGSPPESPKGRARMTRRPSLPVLNGTPPSTAAMARKKSSTSNLRASYGFGSLSMATEQTCRQLRAYRKKLASTDPIGPDVLAELDAELRLTAAALGERAIRTRSSRETRERSKPVSETVLSGLLDQYSERLVSMLNEKLRLRLDDEKDQDKEGERPQTAGGDSNSSSVTLSGDGPGPV